MHEKRGEIRQLRHFFVSFFGNSSYFRAFYVRNRHDEVTMTDETHRFFGLTNFDELFSSVSSKIVREMTHREAVIFVPIVEMISMNDEVEWIDKYRLNQILVEERNKSKKEGLHT